MVTVGRFVVLHHTGYGEAHFDLMIDVGPAAPLRTWRLSHWPPTAEMRITPLPPHRRAYLEYEGRVSGDRGDVRRIAEGNFNLIASCELHLHDRHVTTKIVLPAMDDPA